MQASPAREGAAGDRPRADDARSELQTARLAELLPAHYPAVWRTLRRLGLDEGSADDGAQEAFIVLSRRLGDVHPGAERTFLLACAVRVAANHRRTWRAKHEVVDDHALATEHDPLPSAEQLLDQKRLRQSFDDVLESWPEDIRTAFVLYELEGLSVPEIAQVTETKVGTVASRLRRARELFQASAKRLRARIASGGAP
jgi:RNA polymerase sigma-70 factor (ECF subfamily)